MVTREKLSKLSDEELENLYRAKKEEYDDKISKDRRIRGMLSRKVNKMKEIVQNLEREIDEVIKKNPNVAKLEFDEDKISEKNPEELKNTINSLQKELTNLQSRKLSLSKTINEITSHINNQKNNEKDLETRIEELIQQAENLNENEGILENKELSQLFQEEMDIKENLESLIVEIENLHNKIHIRV